MKFDNYFPLAMFYPPNRLLNQLLVRETGDRGRAFDYTERHLQAVWFDPNWRPEKLVTNRGETVLVEYPGRWNLEAGPDFLGATLRVGPDERRLTGDVEVHIFPADWRHHGHRDDPRYKNVCLHVTYFDGVLADEELPSGALQLALQSTLKADPSFAFEHVDVTSYPYAGRADLPPCRVVLAGWPMDMKMRLLEAAGHERLSRKTQKFASAIRERGVDQVLYEAFMVSLGYHQNKQPFYDLAVRVPVERLRVCSGGDRLRAYALLAGMSGLLPMEINPSWDEETRSFVRHIWDIWWKEREHLPVPMSKSDWNLAGLRPLNHPLRRFMPVAHLFSVSSDGRALLNYWYQGEAGKMVDRVQKSLDPEGSMYWTHRSSLSGVKSVSRIALVGRDRLNAMALNVVIPMLAACGCEAEKAGQLAYELNAEPLNAIMKQSVHYLFGPDCPSSLFDSANRRQGLLQIFHDYCIHDRSQCSRCPLPGYLERQVVSRLV